MTVNHPRSGAPCKISPRGASMIMRKTNHVIIRASDVAVMRGHTDLCHPHSVSSQTGPSSYTTLLILPQSRVDKRLIHKCLPHD
ncbi:hypothetical protein J4Q44_G00203360 [Coregonus suidteri]|uniref:Uncharacterized protein n=1 Tax=Coregonus suidteri TaxID=861788 RepID=A0AAN8LEJ0_9TELE